MYQTETELQQSLFDTFQAIKVAKTQAAADKLRILAAEYQCRLDALHRVKRAA